MCPSFMATGDEKDCTRARANILREFLSADENNPWDHREIYDILDLCLGCKGCKAECPSTVDIAKLKSEFLQHWYDRHGIPLRTRMIANIAKINRLGSFAPVVFNFFLRNSLTSHLIKKIARFAPERSIPLLYRYTLRGWLIKNLIRLNPEKPVSSLCLFIDEFTNYNDVETGIAAVRLLTSLGYRVLTLKHRESARAYISKGLLRKARFIARENIRQFSRIINVELPLVGIEPSAILGFRDEYPDLAGPELRAEAEKLAVNSFTIDEFIRKEFEAGRIRSDSFTDQEMEVLVHIHCQQKAVATAESTLKVLSIPSNYKIREIPSGCCGMAGSFGYEKEHFEISNKIGGMVLFPEVRNAGEATIISAPGTSCRHQIKDGTGRKALHPAEVLFLAMKK